MQWTAPVDQEPRPLRRWEPTEPPHVVIWRALEVISRQLEDLAKRIDDLGRR
jgi:hypothetical protein